MFLTEGSGTWTKSYFLIYRALHGSSIGEVSNPVIYNIEDNFKWNISV